MKFPLLRFWLDNFHFSKDKHFKNHHHQHHQNKIMKQWYHKKNTNPFSELKYKISCTLLGATLEGRCGDCGSFYFTTPPPFFVFLHFFLEEKHLEKKKILVKCGSFYRHTNFFTSIYTSYIIRQAYFYDEKILIVKIRLT